MITSEARKRLEALVQFSDLGSGFNIAMKDLDIRGAGNLLGGEQSGFISEIGFEMYQKILKEAMDELKEEEFKELYDERNTDNWNQNYVKDCVLETDFELRIPEYYINNVAERLSVYQDLDNLTDKDELEKYTKQLIDRFGNMPQVVKELLLSFELRWLAQSLAIEKMVIKQGKMICTFVDNPQSKFYDTEQFQFVLNYVMTHPNQCKISDKSGKLKITFNEIHSLHKVIEQLSDLKLKA